MKYETPMIDILLLEDDVIATSAQPGLGDGLGEDWKDETDWVEW